MGDRFLADELRHRGIKDEQVLRAIAGLSRRDFVPDALAAEATRDRPLSIGHGQTISQPYIVALMSEALQLTPEDRVLEIGTGSGYQAAVLTALAKAVFSIEILPELAALAEARLARLGISVRSRVGNGYLGWPEAAPFDAIILTAAPPHLPQALIGQLAPGGRLVAPVGESDLSQSLVRVTLDPTGRPGWETLLPVRFVPMIGRPSGIAAAPERQ